MSIDLNSMKHTKGPIYKCDTAEQLNAYATSVGGADNSEQFLKDHGVTFEEMQGRWFSFSVDQNKLIFYTDEELASDEFQIAS